MSHQQQSYSYHYLTLTGEGDAHQLVKDYYLGRARAWNKGEIEQGRYQFQQMCIRFRTSYDENLNSNEAIERFLQGQPQRQLFLVPPEFERTLHLVTHADGLQGHGFYLSSRNIQQLAKINAHVKFYDYLQFDDGHDFPYSLALPVEEETKERDEYAYFRIESTGHTVEQLAAITGLSPNVTESTNQGDIRLSHQPLDEGQQPRRVQSTYFTMDSGVEKGQPLAIHIDAVLAKLIPHYERFIPLLLDYRVSFYLVGTGHFVMPYQLSLSKEWILQLAQFKCSVDMDFYAQGT